MMVEWAFSIDMQGKINNCSSFKNNALLPLYEAVVNSICSIQKTKAKSRIDVHFEYTPGIDEGSETIDNIEIVDYAAGFNDDNLDSFLNSDSTFNIEYGCKGLGRFTWLCAFDHVYIRSVYTDGDSRKIREFIFSPTKPYCHIKKDMTPTNDPVCTSVKLCGFKNEYKKQASAYKKTETIADKIVLHCFEYFLSMPELEVMLHDSGGQVSCREIMNRYDSSTDPDELKIGENIFSINHIRIPEGSADAKNQMVFLGNNRVVKRLQLENVGKEPFFDGKRYFYYAAFISSDYLDEHVNSDRSDFDIDADIVLDPRSEITINQIKTEVQPFVTKYLGPFISNIEAKKIQAINDYLTLFPEYKTYCENNQNNIVLKLKIQPSVEEIHKIITQERADDEIKTRNRIRDITNSKKSMKYLDIKAEIEEVLSTIDQSSEVDLAKSVIRRNLILQLFDKKLKLSEEDPSNYSKEDALHDILFHRRSYSTNISSDDLNLWIIDERLLYHSFAASDIELQKYLSESDSNGRPDILMAFTQSQSRKVSSVSIIELKRPMRNDKYVSPIDQLIGYMKEISNGNELSYDGRPLNVGPDTLYFCHAICDITERIVDDADNHAMMKLPDGMGYFMYHPKYRAYIEIISYDKVLSRAYLNNHYMFTKLKLPISPEFQLSMLEAPDGE